MNMQANDALQEENAPLQENHMSVITFGEIEQTSYSALVGLEHTQPWHVTGQDFWQPPIDKTALAKLLELNSYHGALVEARAKLLLRGFVDTGLIDLMELLAVSKDLITFGECYFQQHRNTLGTVVRLSHMPSLGMRHTGRGDFKYVHPLNPMMVSDWRIDEVLCVKLYDVKQTLYGVPDYLSGIKAAILSDSATMFRQAFYDNGAHMGFILYTNDPSMGKPQEQALAEALKKARKQDGKFRSIHLNIPNGQPDAVKVLPLGEIGAKDEFFKIKSTTAQEVMVAHRYPPGMAGIIQIEGTVPADPLKIDLVYYENEVWPLQQILMTVNRRLGGAKLVFEKQERQA